MPSGESVAFVLRCYVATESPAENAPYRLRSIQVQVVVTGDHLLTLHDALVSLPALLGLLIFRMDGAGDTSSTPFSTRFS